MAFMYKVAIVLHGVLYHTASSWIRRILFKTFPFPFQINWVWHKFKVLQNSKFIVCFYLKIFCKMLFYVSYIHYARMFLE